jgi:hypothetical protein
MVVLCKRVTGLASSLARLRPLDWIIYYSPKQIFDSSVNGKEKCQAFTAIGRVVGESV